MNLMTTINKADALQMNCASDLFIVVKACDWPPTIFGWTHDRNVLHQLDVESNRIPKIFNSNFFFLRDQI